MKFLTFVTTAALALNAIAAPSPNPEAAPVPAELVEKDTLEARAMCNYAYNGNTPNHLGPGQTYNCRKVSWVQSSYVCYVGSGPTYCCSGTPSSTSVSTNSININVDLG
ncbi:hypothetical protein PQX77_019589 [Marasmius sp. AFHP31]|nr:hypothetical protein PQX77_019589 [Marasmius sp. AFHP31]